MTDKVDRRGQFNVTGIDPRLIIQTAFSGSRPQGLGFLHHEPGGLSEDELAAVIERAGDRSIHIDYLRGRSMKFNLIKDRDSGEWFFDLDWYDHGRAASERLMREIGLPDVERAIEEARAGKQAEADEWAAQELAAAMTAIRLIAEGQATRPDCLYDIEYENPIYQAWSFGTDRAVKDGWLTRNEESRSYAITEAGRTALKEASSHAD